jgi:FMN-dependent NADH-azoreductase
MSHILHIDSSPRGDRSISRSLSHEFINAWKAAHPDDTVTYRDLGHHPVPLVDETWIAAAFSDPAQHTPEQASTIVISNELIDELLAADYLVFAVPMYNFGIPAGFKAYIDQITRAGKTFKVTETGGYEGLVPPGRKLLVINAASGAYEAGTPAAAVDFLTPYLRALFGFIGITDVTFVKAQGLAYGDEAREQSIAAAQAALHDAVANW